MRPGPRMRLKAESTGGAATALARGMGSAVILIPPAGSRAEPRPPTGFPLFSAHIDGP